MIRKGQQVRIKAERADPGDNDFTRFALEDEDDRGKVQVVTIMPGMTFNHKNTEMACDLEVVE